MNATIRQIFGEQKKHQTFATTEKPSINNSTSIDRTQIYTSARTTGRKCSELSGFMMASRLKVGTRVVRGADWNSGYEMRITRLPKLLRMEFHQEKTYLQQSYEDDSTKSANIKCISPTQISVSNTTKITGAKCPERCGLMMASLLKVGTRVVRGADWNAGHQDGIPPGEGQITSLDVLNKVGWVQVKWASGNLIEYRMGSSGKYYLKLAECSLTIKEPNEVECLNSDAPIPSGPEMARRLKYGTFVVLREDWERVKQDGNPPRIEFYVTDVAAITRVVLDYYCPS
ncbi:unnamed protein product [Allacma fusca]|uniref:MIB/HERC2 domain-containing protein n=1 Tax=Allacma fusca TaxID=39272 RepID=A0A8J2KRB2_9HEXA|nr:unnamed protein product [Allacma fusca]